MNAKLRYKLKKRVFQLDFFSAGKKKQNFEMLESVPIKLKNQTQDQKQQYFTILGFCVFRLVFEAALRLEEITKDCKKTINHFIPA